jgi:hypothetical protein
MRLPGERLGALAAEDEFAPVAAEGFGHAGRVLRPQHLVALGDLPTIEPVITTFLGP